MKFKITVAVIIIVIGAAAGIFFMRREPKNVVMEDLTVGQGTEILSGHKIKVHYTGWLKDGTKFDSSIDRGVPFEFVWGAGQVIPGWEQGLAGMHVGGKRRLTIPSSLGYGAHGAGPIPPYATLKFEVELLEVAP